jgi:hypothetical protein
MQRRKDIFGWLMYDWANSAYVLTVATAVLPSYFAAVVVPPEGAVIGGVVFSAPALWGFMVSLAALLVFLLRTIPRRNRRQMRIPEAFPDRLLHPRELLRAHALLCHCRGHLLGHPLLHPGPVRLRRRQHLLRCLPAANRLPRGAGFYLRQGLRLRLYRRRAAVSALPSAHFRARNAWASARTMPPA